MAINTHRPHFEVVKAIDECDARWLVNEGKRQGRNLRPRFPLPPPPKGPDFEQEEEALKRALGTWADYYGEEHRRFRCGWCLAYFGEGFIYNGAPGVNLEGCAHYSSYLDKDGRRRKSAVRGLGLNGKPGPMNDPFRHPRPNRRIWESTNYQTREGQPHYGFMLGERQFTLECRCRMRRVVRNSRMVAAFCDALVTGKDIMIGVDI